MKIFYTITKARVIDILVVAAIASRAAGRLAQNRRDRRFLLRSCTQQKKKSNTRTRVSERSFSLFCDNVRARIVRDHSRRLRNAGGILLASIFYTLRTHTALPVAVARLVVSFAVLSSTFPSSRAHCVRRRRYAAWRRADVQSRERRAKYLLKTLLPYTVKSRIILIVHTSTGKYAAINKTRDSGRVVGICVYIGRSSVIFLHYFSPTYYHENNVHEASGGRSTISQCREQKEEKKRSSTKNGDDDERCVCVRAREGGRCNTVLAFIDDNLSRYG